MPGRGVCTKYIWWMGIECTVTCLTQLVMRFGYSVTVITPGDEDLHRPVLISHER